MIRQSLRYGVLVVCVFTMGACGHDGVISGSVPGGQDESPATIDGGVLAPNRRLVAAPSLGERFAAVFVAPVYALADNVQNVPNVPVNLMGVEASDAADGAIDNATRFSGDTTTQVGRYKAPLVNGAVYGACGLMVQVGSGSTLTRGFVASQNDQDVSAITEAVVRLLLEFLVDNPSSSLCDFSYEDIDQIADLVFDITLSVGGDSVEELNDQVAQVARDNPTVHLLIHTLAQPNQ